MRTLVHIYRAILIVIPIVHAAQAQESLSMEMTLSETIELALKNNWGVRRSVENLDIASGELKQSADVFLPKVQLSQSFVSTNDPLTAFGFKLKQSAITLQDFIPESLNNPSSINNFSTSIEVQQPLINIDGIKQRKAANYAFNASLENLEWSQSLSVLQAKNLYFRLQLTNKQREVLEYSLETTQLNYKVTSDLESQGLVNRADLLKAKLRVTEIESQLLAAEFEYIRASGDLAHFLDLPSHSQIDPIDSIRIMDVPNDLLAVNQIPEARSDLKALSFQLLASDQLMKSSKTAYLPSLNLFGRYEWNDAELFGFGASNYLVGGKLQWDLFRGGNRMGQIRKATAQRNLAELAYQEKLSAGQRQLTQVQNEIRLAHKQLEVSELAVAQAEESYKIRNDRYQEGLEKTIDLLEAESTWMEKKLNKLKSLNQYQQLIFNLEVLLEEEIILK